VELLSRWNVTPHFLWQIGESGDLLPRRNGIIGWFLPNVERNRVCLYFVRTVEEEGLATVATGEFPADAEALTEIPDDVTYYLPEVLAYEARNPAVLRVGSHSAPVQADEPAGRNRAFPDCRDFHWLTILETAQYWAQERSIEVAVTLRELCFAADLWLTVEDKDDRNTYRKSGAPKFLEVEIRALDTEREEIIAALKKVGLAGVRLEDDGELENVLRKVEVTRERFADWRLRNRSPLPRFWFSEGDREVLQAKLAIRKRVDGWDQWNQRIDEAHGSQERIAQLDDASLPQGRVDEQPLDTELKDTEGEEPGLPSEQELDENPIPVERLFDRLTTSLRTIKEGISYGNRMQCHHRALTTLFEAVLKVRPDINFDALPGSSSDLDAFCQCFKGWYPFPTGKHFKNYVKGKYRVDGWPLVKCCWTQGVRSDPEFWKLVYREMKNA